MNLIQYKYLDLYQKIKIYNLVMKMRENNLGGKWISRFIKDQFGIVIGKTTIRRWFKGRTPLKFLSRELLSKSLQILSTIYNNGVPKEYNDLSLKEALMIHEKVLQLYSIGLRASNISNLLKLNNLHINMEIINKWVQKGCRPRKTNLEPTPELAMIASASVSDGCISKKQGMFSLQMKDREPVELIAECLKKICQRGKYHLNYIPSNGTYAVSCRRKDLVDYLKYEKNILMLLQRYPIEFIRFFFEAEGGPNVTITYTQGRTYFDFEISATNSNLKLLKAIQKQLKLLGIDSRIRLKARAGTTNYLCGRTFTLKKNCYRLSIWKKESILRYNEVIGFISKRKKEKLNDLVNIIKTHKKSKERSIEWTKLYRYYKRGKPGWVKEPQLFICMNRR